MINQFINTLKNQINFQNLIFFFILYSFIFIKLNNIPITIWKFIKFRTSKRSFKFNFY